MSRWTIVIQTDADRARAVAWAAAAKEGMRIDFKKSKRSMPQNDKMWALLTEVSQQVEHNGRKYEPDQWKVLFMHACGREVQFLPALDGSTFLPWGQSSSELTKEEMSDLIEFILAWGAQHGVVFKRDGEQAAERAA